MTMLFMFDKNLYAGDIVFGCNCFLNEKFRTAPVCKIPIVISSKTKMNARSIRIARNTF
jgi:hypothetical protein